MIRLRWLLLSLLFWVLPGCLSGVLPKAPERAVYGLPEPLASAPSARPWSGVLRIEAARAPAPLDSVTLIVRRGDGELQALAGVRWAAPLPSLFSALLARQAAQARLADAVSAEVGVAASRLLLGATIDHFELAESESGLVPHIELRVRLVCVRTQSVLASSEPIRLEAEPIRAGAPAREAAQALRANAAVMARRVIDWARQIEVSACPE